MSASCFAALPAVLRLPLAGGPPRANIFAA